MDLPEEIGLFHQRVAVSIANEYLTLLAREAFGVELLFSSNLEAHAVFLPQANSYRVTLMEVTVGHAFSTSIPVWFLWSIATF